MKYFFTLTSMLIIHFSLIHADRKVIDKAAADKHALVVSSQTIQEISLDENHMTTYAENLLEYSSELLDTTMFSEIIQNAGSPDTAAWKDGELKNLLVIGKRDEEISKKYLFQKLTISGKKQIRYYTRYINRYNETEPADRNIYYFSKPIYNNSGEFAIVQWDNGHGGLSGEGGINLYRLKGHEWTEVGVIDSWKH
jgi:hypothetical protein